MTQYLIATAVVLLHCRYCVRVTGDAVGHAACDVDQFPRLPDTLPQNLWLHSRQLQVFSMQWKVSPCVNTFLLMYDITKPLCILLDQDCLRLQVINHFSTDYNHIIW